MVGVLMTQTRPHRFIVPVVPLHSHHAGSFHAHDMDTLWSLSLSYLSVSTPDLMPPMGAR